MIIVYGLPVADRQRFNLSRQTSTIVVTRFRGPSGRPIQLLHTVSSTTWL